MVIACPRAYTADGAPRARGGQDVLVEKPSFPRRDTACRDARTRREACPVAKTITHAPRGHAQKAVAAGRWASCLRALHAIVKRKQTAATAHHRNDGGGDAFVERDPLAAYREKPGSRILDNPRVSAAPSVRPVQAREDLMVAFKYATGGRMLYYSARFALLTGLALSKLWRKGVITSNRRSVRVARGFGFPRCFPGSGTSRLPGDVP